MWGVVNHISSLKISTSCTTALKNITDTLVFAPSIPNIIDRRAQLFLALSSFPTTTVQ